MSMPKVPDINPEITITRQDAANMIISSIAMEELALAHILNAEGEKLQYVLGTLESRDPGEVTVCDIMEFSKSTHKTLRNIIQAEMLLNMKLTEAVELDDSDNACQLSIRGQVTWRDGDNVALTRPNVVEVSLLQDGEVYRTVSVDALGDGKFAFTCLPAWKDSSTKYSYRIDEIAVPAGYTKKVEGNNIINTVEPGSIDISGQKIWRDNDNISSDRPADILVYLIRNGLQFAMEQVDSPPDTETTVSFTFPDMPQFDEEGRPYVYTVDEDEHTNYTKSITGFTITNTHIDTP